MSHYKLCFYVPEAELETVKEAVFAAGAGQIGNYSHCCWQTLGTGQFKPNDAATPFIGTANTVESVMEYKVEMICAEGDIKRIIAALKQAHPYEEPAYDVWRLEKF